MKMVETVDLSTVQKVNIFRLWNQEYPENLMLKDLKDLDSYLEGLHQKKHYLLVDEKNKVEGWLLLFQRENENWFAMILDKQVQRKGYGTKLLNKVKEVVSVLNAWVIDHNNDKKANGVIYSSPLPFYRKNDFKILKGQRLVLENISTVKICWQK